MIHICNLQVSTGMHVQSSRLYSTGWVYTVGSHVGSWPNAQKVARAYQLIVRYVAYVI